MDIHPLTKLSQREALLYAICCEIYCEEDNKPELAVSEKGELFLRCKMGDMTIWHGRKKLDQLEAYLKFMMKYEPEEERRRKDEKA